MSLAVWFSAPKLLSYSMEFLFGRSKDIAFHMKTP